MTLHLSRSSVICRLAISARVFANPFIRYVKMVRPSSIHRNRARPFPSDIHVSIAPLALALLLGRNPEVPATDVSRQSPPQQLLATADIDLWRAHWQLRDTVMLATRFASPAIRRKGESVTGLYQRALAEGWSGPAREARWRRFIIATASLNRDLDSSARLTSNDATRRAHDALARIVDENADLLDDGTSPTAVHCCDRT